jgi:hypothetical protein
MGGASGSAESSFATRPQSGGDGALAGELSATHRGIVTTKRNNRAASSRNPSAARDVVARCNTSKPRNFLKYFGLSYGEARRNALAKLRPCRAFRLGDQKSRWLVSAVDLAELIDRQRAKAR